ncbi:sensor histidine kinase [Embleya sp. NBC_00896]|uniref:sensor histidine kinase n=1 Tax=Embleya sp. NBC_00896 TaxID=2975961 RepID=UPI003862D729|nr:sensor histidine kinase [Embleya sp. NBC_00896]
MGTLPRISARPAREHSMEFAITVLVGIAVLGFTMVDMRPLDTNDVLGLSIVFGSCTALFLRRTHPLAVAFLTLLASALYYPLVYADGPLFLTFAIALYTAAAAGHLLVSSLLGAGIAAAIVSWELSSGENHLADAALFLLCGWIVAVIAIGGMLHNRNAFLREAEQRAAEAERILEEEARRRAVEERLRIARELHDVLGHHLSLINVQSGAALHGFAHAPEQAEEALAAIKTTSRDALRELRGTLGVLRQVDEEAPTAPAPGLARIEELIQHVHRGGVEVRLELPHGIRPLPPAVDLAAYRIVQEALTNVTRHSGAAEAVVRIAFEERRIRIRVDDNGRGGDVQPGNGVLGMGERARALGGTFDAGARPDGGFRVSAMLPLRRGGAK